MVDSFDILDRNGNSNVSLPWLFGFVWLAVYGLSAQAGSPNRLSAPPNLIAESALTIDAKTGIIFFDKNADEPRAVASTQKLLTALIVAEHGDLDTMLKVERTDTRIEPTRAGIKIGKEYSRRELLKVLLVKSGNDVAKCLARSHAGSQAKFSIVMNQRARQLGMGTSNFVNAHGLTEDGQHSTARDMAKLAFVAYRNKHIREVVNIKKMDFSHPGPKGWSDTFTNTNRILHSLPFVNGMKTGFTDAAGRCLVCSGVYEGREVISVVLGSTSEAVWDDSAKLLRWAIGYPDEQAALKDEAEAEAESIDG